ncbi:MAG: protein kinase [Candidatus Dormibacteraeota bacterium]|nr:protein kinase [Candidatus Dormibacteraeota bacterium]
MPLVPGSDLGPYRIVDKIGQGGMASVYKAYHAALSRFVALKVLPPQLAQDPQFEHRFREEAVAVANLRHTNIMAVYDYGELEGVTFIVNEFIDGGTFDLQMGSPLPLTYVIDILSPVAAALDYAHARGVIHRDVKPSNILVGRDGRPILGDFGLARMMMPEHDLTQTGMILGTPSYMAPEQGNGNPVRQSDIYSLGIIAYQALTGRVPYQAATPMAIIIAHQTEPLPLPRSINPDIPVAVEEVLLKVLARSPEDRYPTGDAFIRALTRAREAPVEVSPAPGGAQPSAPAPPSTPGGGRPLPPATPPRTSAQPSPAPIPSTARAPKPSRSGLWVAGVIGGILLLLLVLCGGGGLLLAAVSRSSPVPSAEATASGDVGVKGMSAADATKVASDQGFPKCDTQGYEPTNTLHVLICNPADDNGEKVFFFTDKFVAADAQDPSARVEFGTQSDKEIAITYTLFKAADPDCCPTGGTATVRFQWDGNQLLALDQVPSSDDSKDGSRR